MSTITDGRYGARRGVISRSELSALDVADTVEGVELANVSPGEVLAEEFMVPFGLSARALSREIGVPANRITAIVAGTRAVTAETALLLAERFGTSAEFWLHLQAAFDLEKARRARRAAVAA